MLEFTSWKRRAVVLVVTDSWRSDGSSIGLYAGLSRARDQLMVRGRRSPQRWGGSVRRLRVTC